MTDHEQIFICKKCGYRGTQQFEHIRPYDPGHGICGYMAAPERIAAPDDLTPLRTKGAAAWADVPDASAWVEGMRGNAGTEGSERQELAEKVREGIADFIADNWPDRKHSLSEIEAGIRAVEIKARLIALTASARAPEPVSDERITQLQMSLDVIGQCLMGANFRPRVDALLKGKP